MANQRDQLEAQKMPFEMHAPGMQEAGPGRNGRVRWPNRPLPTPGDIETVDVRHSDAQSACPFIQVPSGHGLGLRGYRPTVVLADEQHGHVPAEPGSSIREACPGSWLPLRKRRRRRSRANILPGHRGFQASVGLKFPRPKMGPPRNGLLGFFPFTYLTMACYRVKRESFSEMTNVDQAGHEGGNLAFRVRFRQNRLDLGMFFPANLHGPNEKEVFVSVQIRTGVVRKADITMMICSKLQELNWHIYCL